MSDDVLEITPEPTTGLDEETKALEEAAALMAKAASDRANRKQLLSGVEAALSKVRMIDFPDLIDSPIVQSFISAMGYGDLQPGQTRNRGTLAEIHRDWTWKDLQKMVTEGTMPLRRFTPNESLTLIWQGLELRVIEDTECEVPACFHDIYLDRQKAKRNAVTNEHYLLGISDVPPPDMYHSASSAKVRAWATQMRRFGRNGGTIMTGVLQDWSPAADQKEGVK